MEGITEADIKCIENVTGSCYDCRYFWFHPQSSCPFCKFYIASIINPWHYCEKFKLIVNDNIYY
jgi:hypothetical protein